MTSQQPTSASAASGSAGAQGLPRPGELHFLLPEEKTDLKKVFGGGGVSYGIVVLVVVLFFWNRPDRQILAQIPDFIPTDLVFLEEVGPGGGGGGGGNKSPEPPKTAPVPAVKAVEPEPIPTPTPEPVQPPPPVVAAEVPAISINEVPAVVAAATNTAPASLGTGSDGGAGSGRGDGIGPGSGSGLGPGSGGGTGDGVYRPGNGIDNPTLLSSAQPNYTSEGMMRRIQGTVALDCVVQANGQVGKCDIVKPLDSDQYGLDGEAIKAAKRFKFNPGKRKGEPVAVLVRIELTFNIR